MNLNQNKRYIETIPATEAYSSWKREAYMYGGRWHIRRLGSSKTGKMAHDLNGLCRILDKAQKENRLEEVQL